MPNTREKLIELLDEAEEWADHRCDELECETCSADKMKGNCVQQLMVDRLIANGVTVQKWIPVTERLPEGMDWVLCACKDGEVRILCYDYIMDDWDIHGRPTCYGKAFVTHWMPLPEPPKGE